MDKVKIFISDPQVLFREGIHFILSGEEDFEVTGETTGNEEALAQIEANPPNIVILSMKDAKLKGTDAARRIKRNLPALSVILVLDNTDDDQVFAALKSGVSACLNKDTDPEYLLDTIRVIAQGSQPIIEALFTPGLAARALAEFEDTAALSEQLDNMLARLVPREAEILVGIAAGNSLEQVTAKLSVNEETIRRNLRMVASKLVANDLARAVLEAAQRGLPVLIRGTARRGGSKDDYVTRAEFNEFKESLFSRFRSLIGEKVK